MGCSNSQSGYSKVDNYSSIPKWVFDPTSNGQYKYAAVGMAEISYYGYNAQRDIAIKRALEELAMQQNVKVVSETKIIELTTNEKSDYTNNTVSTYIIDNNIKAKVINEWKSPKDKNLYIRVIIIE